MEAEGREGACVDGVGLFKDTSQEFPCPSSESHEKPGKQWRTGSQNRKLRDRRMHIQGQVSHTHLNPLLRGPALNEQVCTFQGRGMWVSNVRQKKNRGTKK